MDFHILIVIGCVLSASVLSFLFINKIFRRKTFEEVVAEKRALSANLYKAGGGGGAGSKKPKKKELKREKKQRQREQQKPDASNNEADEDYSDGQSEGQASVEDDAAAVVLPGLSKQHVEFEPDAEILTENRRSSNAEKENQPTVAAGKKGKKDKRNGSKGSGASSVAGILVNKNEAVAVKLAAAPATNGEETATPSLNNFEVRAPKDVVELKKQEQKERKEDNNKQQAQKKNGSVTKKEKSIELDASAPASTASVAPAVPVQVTKQINKQQQQTGSPKTQHNQTNNKTKQQQQHNNKQKHKESLTAKDLAQALDKLAEHQNQSFGVSALMNVFARTELNRSEIQILIDYLLNKQQDMPASHAEWSDDICQKLKRQLEEKEKLLAEEQEASIGIQAKLRELRQEVNTERAQMHARTQAYNDKLQSKEQELSALNQELANANDKLTIERQQFQAVLREKQASTDLLPQLQRLQQDLAHKEKCLSEMTAFVTSESEKKNEIIQSQTQRILSLEQQCEELEVRQNNSIFELEQRKQLETENSELKVERCNLHNALESAQSELKRVCNSELQELRQQIAALETNNENLTQQLNQANSNAVQATAAQSEQAQVQSEALVQKQNELSSLQAKLSSLNDDKAEQQQLASTLQSQLKEAQEKAEQLQANERQLEQELQEQREKNNQQQKQLQQQQQQQQKAASDTNGGAVKSSSSSSSSAVKSEQQRIRELYQRLYPDAVKLLAATALNASFDEWIEQVLSTHIKQQQEKEKQTTLSSSHKSTQSNNSNNISNNHSTTTTTNPISSNNSSLNSKSSTEQLELHKQNLQLRTCNDKLTQLVTKTTNTLVDLEQRAREQDEHWRSIVSQKEELITKLQQHASNGEQDI
ncbi:ribosome-binding protein 1 isoform X2 [Drosophila tropicalis]|uniref:ribosome-binding protein 1 isoform X2 n=1 Tax=Drosophila tropicalis TaxID=46794 RepID=UPI0035AB9D2A